MKKKLSQSANKIISNWPLKDHMFVIDWEIILWFKQKICAYLATLRPRKNFAMSWSDDCQGRPRARTTVLLSTSSSFELSKTRKQIRKTSSHVDSRWYNENHERNISLYISQYWLSTKKIEIKFKKESKEDDLTRDFEGRRRDDAGTGTQHRRKRKQKETTCKCQKSFRNWDENKQHGHCSNKRQIEKRYFITNYLLIGSFTWVFNFDREFVAIAENKQI